MFSLIITIISIALVAALAVATIYYGGDAFNQGSSKARASTIVNQAQQIVGANTLLRAETGSFAASMSDLQDGGYLASLPATANLTYVLSTDNVITATGTALTQEVCEKIEEVAGRADTVAEAGSQPANQFGCYDATVGAGEAHTFYFNG